MTRFLYQQSGPNSCAAAVTMVALQELSVAIPQCLSNLGTQECEISIWDAMKDLPVGPGNTDWQCTPLSVVKFLHTLHLSVAIVHNATRVDKLLKAWSKYGDLGKFYEYKFKEPLAKASSTIGKVQSEINLPDDFDRDARVILLCLIQGGNPPSPLHYLLARKDGNSYWIMNSDGATDTQLNKNGLETFLTEDVGQGVSIGSQANYIYTGIALIVHKKP